MVNMLFAKQGADHLRTEIENEKAKQWAELLPKIEEHCARPYEHPDDSQKPPCFSVSVLRDNCNAGIYGSFGYLVSGERRFFESARDHLMPMLTWQRWGIALEDGRWFELNPANAVKAFAVFLDWCGDAISRADRDYIVLGLENFGARPVIRDHEVQVGWYNEAGRVNNWVAVMNGSMGLAALLLWREKPIFREALNVCVRHIKRYLDWVEEDGSVAGAGGWGLEVGAKNVPLTPNPQPRTPATRHVVPYHFQTSAYAPVHERVADSEQQAPDELRIGLRSQVNPPCLPAMAGQFLAEQPGKRSLFLLCQFPGGNHIRLHDAFRFVRHLVEQRDHGFQ